jgi:Tat protein secretion system quality control protein TatD with DNase activity
MEKKSGRKVAKQRYQDFLGYLKREGEELKKEKLATQVKAYIARQMKNGYAPTTVRTHLGHLLGELRRTTDEKMQSVQLKELSRFLEAQIRDVGVSKAEAIGRTGIDKVAKKIGASHHQRMMLEVLVATCCRVGNLAEMTHVRWADNMWTVLMKRHKTRGRGVTGDLMISGELFSSTMKNFLLKLKVGEPLFEPSRNIPRTGFSWST